MQHDQDTYLCFILKLINLPQIRYGLGEISTVVAAAKLDQSPRAEEAPVNLQGQSWLRRHHLCILPPKIYFAVRHRGLVSRETRVDRGERDADV